MTNRFLLLLLFGQMVYPSIRKRMIGRMEISVKLSEYFF